MKVLNVVDGSGWTGGVEQAMLLALEHRRRGIDARLAVHGDNAVLREAASLGIPSYAYQSDGSGFGNVIRLRRLLSEKYDIVIGHKPGAVKHLILAGVPFSRRPRFIGVRRVSFPVSRLTVYRAPSQVVAVSRSVARVLEKSGMKNDGITVIPSGVDVDRFRPDEKLRADERRKRGLERRRVILNLAKFVPDQKGQQLLFAATARLKERFSLALILAGLETDGEDAVRLAGEYGLGGTVSLEGFRRDIPALLNAADLFVFPSLPGLDAIAGSVLQAMACGKVVVSSAVGGVPEYLRDGENGFLVPPGDGARLAEAMERALSLDPAERERIGEAARNTVVGGYSTAAMADAYLKLFREPPS